MKAIYCLLALLGMQAVAYAKPPERIVSLGLCTDQLLLMLVDRERIASLTYTSADNKMSYMADEVGDIPLNHGRIEEVIPHEPDLVVGSLYASWNTVRMLRLLNYEVKLISPPKTLDEVRHVTREFARWVGEQNKAEQLIDQMDSVLNEISQQNKNAALKSVVVYSPNGYTIGGNTLENDLFLHAGYRNLSAEIGIEGFQKISLEKLVSAQPDYLLLDNHVYNPHSQASAYIHHPVLSRMVAAENRLFVPSRLRDCGAPPVVAEAVRFLADSH